MKKIYTLLFNYLSLLFLEFVFLMLSYKSVETSSILNILLEMIPISCLITITTSLFKEKINKILMIILYSFLGIWYNIYFVFNSIFDTQFSLSVFTISDQALTFKKSVILEILKHFYGIILLFLPLIFLIVLKNKINFKKLISKNLYIMVPIFLISIIICNINIYSFKNIKYSIYDLYYNINDNVLNIEKLGVLNATLIDLDRTIRGFTETITAVNNDKNTDSIDDEVIEYGYNSLNLNLDELINSSNNDIKTIANYLENETVTKKNKYTGVFKNKNLIYITAESFSEIAVSKELTPTLYKLVNTGLTFTNYYSSNNLSTIGGEFQSLTGLYADTSFLSTWRSGNNSFPFGLGTIFKNSGYNVYAYHNYSATFQDRDKYLKAMGFDNYLACNNGLEKRMTCSKWPNSDIDMINSTYTDYINSDKPFLAYYMTVSGHFEYSFSGNEIAKKNKKLVEDLPYSDKVKAYLATQIELDKALESLINILEEKDILDDTVIVLLCDHYPYGLTIDEINELSSYERDSVVEVNSNNLIIWNSTLKDKKITKTCMSIDVIPTVYNLFGLDYDSRLFMGKDILSNADGIAFFSNRSFKTDKITYFASTNTANIDVSKDYINEISNIISNRRNISKLIIKTNFYKYIKEKD